MSEVTGAFNQEIRKPNFFTSIAELVARFFAPRGPDKVPPKQKPTDWSVYNQWHASPVEKEARDKKLGHKDYTSQIK